MLSIYDKKEVTDQMKRLFTANSALTVSARPADDLDIKITNLLAKRVPV